MIPLLNSARSSTRAELYDYFSATAIMATATLAALGIDQFLPRANVLPVLLIGVLAAAVRTSVRPALWSSLLGLLIYNYFFTEPYHTLTIKHRDDLMTLGFFVLLSSVTGNLATRLRQQMLALRESKARIEDLLGLSRKLAGAPDQPSILHAAAEFLESRVDAGVVFVRPNQQRQMEVVVACSTKTQPLNDEERTAASLAWCNSATASGADDRISSQKLLFLPLCGESGPLVVIGFRTFNNASFPAEIRSQIEGFCQLIAQALDRARLVEDLEATRIEAETERLRSALLSSVSHDLKTPLAAMIGSTSSLLQYQDRLSPADRQELLEATLQEAERLNRYIQNLLDMTRLGYGRLKLERDWVSLTDILGSATHRLQSVLSPFEVRVSLDSDIPLLYVHAALIEQAVVNILENAARFAPPASLIAIDGSLAGDDLILEISDQGPGIPLDERERVFDMFYTAAKGDRQQGTGLGLAICHGMIGAHGGRVEVLDGKFGSGTSMRISLPLQSQPPLPEDVDVSEDLDV